MNEAAKIAEQWPPSVISPQEMVSMSKDVREHCPTRSHKDAKFTADYAPLLSGCMCLPRNCGQIGVFLRPLQNS